MNLDDELKTITDWTKDRRCPVKKQTLWKSIQAGYLKAKKPLGSRVWLVSWSDLRSYLNGEP